jgi:hypothetical protein
VLFITSTGAYVQIGKSKPQIRQVHVNLRDRRKFAYRGKIMKKIAVPGLLILLLTAFAFAAPKVERIGPFSGDASDKVKAALEPNGYRVFLPNTLQCCEIWLAAKVPAKKNTVAATSYPGLGESSFLGVITFPKGGALDFRGQQIRQGTYTMRYEGLPSDGNHMGAAPYPDLILLIPIGDDLDPSLNYDFGKLVELSAAAAHSAHPAAFEMIPADNGEPAVTQTDEGWVVFHSAFKNGEGKNVPVAFVMKGSAGQ